MSTPNDQRAVAETAAAANEFTEEVMAATPGDNRLEMCIQCGTCGGSCPSGADMEYTPRQIFAMIRAGMREEVLRANTQWYCVECYYCTVRCPQDVHVTDLMYGLKNLSTKYGHKHRESNAFASNFIWMIEQFGRSFEVGIAAGQFLRQLPGSIQDLTPMGMGMFFKGRLALMPTRIKGVEQMRAIVNKAKELEAKQ